jgi:rubrerythrin
MVEDRLIHLINEQIKIEETHVKNIKQELENMHNIAAKLLLLEIQKDSEKHALILKGILEVIKQADTKPLWEDLLHSYVEKEVIKRNLENHIMTEMKMIEQLNQEIKGTKDKGVKLLLEHILEDEKKHHKILQTIIRESYKIKP